MCSVSFLRGEVLKRGNSRKGEKYNLFQGEVQFLTGGDSPRTPKGADQVEFLNRRYSPDGRNKSFVRESFADGVQTAMEFGFVRKSRCRAIMMHEIRILLFGALINIKALVISPDRFPNYILAGCA